MDISSIAGNAHPGFIRLSDVYKLAKETAEEIWHIPDEWFPELSGFLDNSVAEAIREEKRLIERQVFYSSGDSYRITQVSTLWFDAKPFCILQAGGRSGRDAKGRFVTDPSVLATALAYLVEKMLVTPAENDVYPADYELPVEAVFDFYSSGTAASLGFEVAATRRDIYEYAGNRDEMPALEHGHLVIIAYGVEPAKLLRSGDSYYELVREVTPADNAASPNLARFVEAVSKDRGERGKNPMTYVYQECKQRPADYRDAVPL
ncbi:hypothetical protein F6X40_09590 [Paraburkholderia sp. UCT31]|uniref:hypothetical protein n=1 Tax=Paraburkholderia sp. UCT31 TaxID=2615209 RepID=UPI001654D3D4|nr:hypothetical protein [Paraburkholderia sp. UCT31]MBC8737060.1 hypothetical protein [Paraburkholderia sp. UCT31]